MRVLSAVFLSGALAAVALPVPVLAETAPATITVTGEGTVTAAPDLATVSLGVTTQGETAAEAMAANTSALTAVLDRVKAAGVEDRDIQTSTLNLNPNWSNSDGSSMPVIQGYVATNVLQIRVRDLPKLGEVLDAAITDGANTLNGISFGLAEPEPAMDEARKAAVAKARARAELLTGAAGVGLGRIVSISESGFMPPMPMYRMEAALAEAPVPVEGGEVGVSASVTVTWEIAQ
ncbi:SIMPL domain-containing protein [Tabrizicola sp. TH137]|uniref:SIMPL domain-containing protein n=1 Tax=Tabrizicola sp. TH137 TaxID=2067452 RepID=UPI000C7B608B|nr:SIMPL domain-containing protein [Tabrizicola sp. TH137]PLL11279.1 SIMPL domain-containing protein [Tabrizicola sp. TH137]